MESTKSYKKPVTKTAKTPNTVNGRDTFQTPAYAVDLLIPFIPNNVKYIWECAAGAGLMVRSFRKHGFNIIASDLVGSETVRQSNFLDMSYNNYPGEIDVFGGQVAIITNPPFSIKEEFIEASFSYGLPFAFLINADYSGRQIDWINRGCEKIIPTRRINYLTPNILRRIHEGEVWKIEGKDRNCTLAEYKTNDAPSWKTILDTYNWCHNYQTLEEVSNELLAKYSSSPFHSMWLTHGFGIGRTETFVDLPLKEIKENILCR